MFKTEVIHFTVLRKRKQTKLLTLLASPFLKLFLEKLNIASYKGPK